MSTKTATIDQTTTLTEQPTNWTRGLHRLAGIGAKTDAVVTRLAGMDSAFNPISKLGDEVLAGLATALSHPWIDEAAAELLERFHQRLHETGHDFDGPAIERWVRAHPNDPEAVTECAFLSPPDDVTVLARLSKKGSQKRVFLATWRQGSREVVLKQLLGSLAEQESVLGRELQSHPLAMRHPNVIATLPLTNGRRATALRSADVIEVCG